MDTVGVSKILDVSRPNMNNHEFMIMLLTDLSEGLELMIEDFNTFSSNSLNWGHLFSKRLVLKSEEKLDVDTDFAEKNSSDMKRVPLTLIIHVVHRSL